MVKNQEESLLFFIYDRQQDRLDVLNNSNSYMIVNPNNLTAQAELLLTMAVNPKDKGIDKSKISQASKMIERAMQEDKFDGKNYYVKGIINELEEDNNKALANYEKSISLDPYTNLLAHIYYIRLLSNTGSKEKALQSSDFIINQYDDKTLRSKLGIRPYYAQLMSELLKTRAQLYFESGQKEKAINDLNRASAINPSDSTIEALKVTILTSN